VDSEAGADAFLKQRLSAADYLIRASVPAWCKQVDVTDWMHRCGTQRATRVSCSARPLLRQDDRQRGVLERQCTDIASAGSAGKYRSWRAVPGRRALTEGPFLCCRYPPAHSGCSCQCRGSLVEPGCRTLNEGRSPSCRYPIARTRDSLVSVNVLSRKTSRVQCLNSAILGVALSWMHTVSAACVAPPISST